MKKRYETAEMRREYRLDYGKAVWGRYAAGYAAGTRVERIDEATLLSRGLPKSKVVELSKRAPRFPLADRAEEAGSHYKKKVA